MDLRNYLFKILFYKDFMRNKYFLKIKVPFYK